MRRPRVSKKLLETLLHAVSFQREIFYYNDELHRRGSTSGEDYNHYGRKGITRGEALRRLEHAEKYLKQLLAWLDR